jgi:hypothetical protein
VKRGFTYGPTVSVLVGLVVMLLLPGCKGPPPSRVQFTNAFADRNAKLYKASRDFRKSLDPLYKDGTVPSISSVKKARDDAKSTLEDVQSEFRDSRMPRKGGSSAEAMFDSYKAFLDTEDEIMTKDYDRIIKVLESGKSPGSMKSEISDIYDEIEEKENKAMKDFNDKEGEFAKAYNLQVKANPGGTRNKK